MSQLTWTTITSSNIKSIAYDEASLYVEFKSDTVYEYTDVPQSVYDSLIESESKGKFLTTHIKNKFKYKKVL